MLSGLAETLISDVVIPLSQTGGFGLKPEYELPYVGVDFSSLVLVISSAIII